MKAMVVKEGGGIALRDVPKPEPKPEQILVRIRAAGLNRAELGIAAGHKHGNAGGAGSLLGLEFAGEVEAVGRDVTGFKAGDRVMCSGNGGYAEYGVTDWGYATEIPAGMGFEQAAALPIALRTMHDALVTNGRLKRGEAVMIQGASSGVGLMGLRIAKHLGAALVVGSSTDAGRRARLGAFGADLAVDTKAAGWADEVLKATGGKGVDLIVDQVSGDTVNEAMRATAVLGRIVNVGRLGGARAPFDFDLHALRRIAYIGVTFRTRSVAEVREINRRMKADLWDAVEAGTLTLPVDRVFPLAEAEAAQAHMSQNHHLGKIVLRV